jgi:enoyl-CoA hydratase
VSQSYKTLQVTEEDSVRVITLNRPDKRNALNAQAYDELDDVLRSGEPRCIVLTGAGSAFCVGDDVGELMAGGGLDDFLGEHVQLDGASEALLHTDVPVIAAVHGFAVGWGMELALMADVRIASTTARFGELYVLRGLCSDVAGMARLAQLVGREHAARLLYTGEIIDAARSAAIGLVSEVVEPDQLLDRAMSLARSIAANPPLAVRRLKLGMRRALDPDWYEFGSWVRRAQGDLSRSADHRESVNAFLDKRPAVYTGH